MPTDAADELAQGLRRRGFRKWYERELLGSHAHMALALLATLGLMASLEAFMQARSTERVLNALFVLLCAGIGLWALRRYLYRLMQAESVAHQAQCPGCQAYGQLEPDGSVPVSPRSEDEGSSLAVRCRRCGTCWRIDAG